MGGGDLNLKKSWHPSTLRNIERVWKAEQKHEAEKQKIEQLQKELAEERAREQIQTFAEDQGVVKKKEEKLDWMYQGPAAMVNRDDYLLGKKIDKTFETMQLVENGKAAEDDTSDVTSSVFNSQNLSGTATVDLANKIREDPLFNIMKKEKEQRKNLLTNPVKMKQLQQMLKASLPEKSKKKNKKSKKKKYQQNDFDEETPQQRKKHKKQKSTYSDEEEFIYKHRSVSEANHPLELSPEHCSSKHEDSPDPRQYVSKSRESNHRPHYHDSQSYKHSYSYKNSNEDYSERSKNNSKYGSSHQSDEKIFSNEYPSFKQRDYLSPKRKEYSLKQREYSPKRKEYSRLQKEYSPKQREYSSKQKEYSPKWNDYSLKRKDYSPNRKNYSPKRKDYSPKRKDYSPKRKDYSSKQNDYSPKRKDYSPKRKEYSLQRPNQRYKDVSNHRENKHVNSEEDEVDEERLLKEMQENAKWREKQRKKNTDRYKEEDEREDNVKRVDALSFMKPMLSKAAGKGSLENRVKQKIFSIQRSSAAMDKNFARRD